MIKASGAGAVMVHQLNRKARLTVTMPDGQFAYVDLTAEQAAAVGERLDNVSHAMERG
jgi:hypothetical protein